MEGLLENARHSSRSRMVTASFVSGLAIAARSTAWKSSLCSRVTGAWPVMHRIGMESPDADRGR